MRKTFTYKLSPTPAQQQALQRVLTRCRTLYNIALEERKTAWERRGVAISYYQQQAELPELKGTFPTTQRSILTCYKPCSCAASMPLPRSSAASSTAKRPALHVSRGCTATTPAPFPSTATARCGMVGY